MTKKPTIIIFIVDKKLKEKLIKFAKKQDRPYGYICRKAVEKYLRMKD